MSEAQQSLFFTTRFNIPNIEPLFLLTNQNSYGKIQMVELPLPRVEGMPPRIEFTTDTLPHIWTILLQATELLEEPFENQCHLDPNVIVFKLGKY